MKPYLKLVLLIFQHIWFWYTYYLYSGLILILQRKFGKATEHYIRQRVSLHSLFILSQLVSSHLTEEKLKGEAQSLTSLVRLFHREIQNNLVSSYLSFLTLIIYHVMKTLARNKPREFYFFLFSPFIFF